MAGAFLIVPGHVGGVRDLGVGSPTMQ
jgi:hypothetical protein